MKKGEHIQYAGMTIAELRRNINSDTQPSIFKTKKETQPSADTRPHHPLNKNHNHPQYAHSATKLKRKIQSSAGRIHYQVPRTPPVISPSDNTDAFIRAQVSGIPSLHTTHHSNERLPRIKQKCRRHPSASSQENSSGGNTLHRHQGEQSPSAHRGYHRLRSLYQQKQSGTHRRAPHFVVLILSPPLSFLPAAGGSTSLPQ